MNSPTTVKDIYIGQLDARDEIDNDGFESFLKSFVMPPNFDLDGLISGNKCFICGYKGTGKTALLYYLESKVTDLDSSAYISYVFFKEQYGNIRKKEIEQISKKIFNSVCFDNDVLTTENDFDYIWKWILFQRIISDNELNNGGLFVEDENWNRFKDTIASILTERKDTRKFIIPRQVKLAVEYSVDLTGTQTVSPGILLDFDNTENHNEYSIFAKLIDDASFFFTKLTRSDIPYYIFIDEMEAYYAHTDIFKRDLRMLRDLITTTKALNNLFTKSGYANTKIICSLRTEIINSISRFVPAKEINKITGSFGCPLVWDYNNTNSFYHPIMEIWLKRIEVTEANNDIHFSNRDELIATWFPDAIDGIPVVNYILNNSWSKPRDIVRFLTAAKNSLHSDSRAYTQAVFDACNKEYSSESLKELVEELNALYKSEETNDIITCMTGFLTRFTYFELEERIEKYFKSSILNGRLTETLNDLYRLGFIGNYSPVVKKWRWQHKGDDKLVIDDEWLIEVHRALHKTLSLSSKHGKQYKRLAHSNTIENQTVEVTVRRIVPGFLLTSFEANGATHNGSIHISELSHEFIRDVKDFTTIGSKHMAQVLSFDKERSKWKLSIKNASDT